MALTFGRVRADFELPEGFPAEVLAEAEAAEPAAAGEREDATGLPLVTIDPPGAKDLDQALLVQARPRGGFRVHYAIADLAVFVRPGGAVDAEARRRGQTLYLPDGAVPLHPPVLSEDAASLLPGVTRPSVLWTIDTDAEATPVSARVRRALVRSRERFDYRTVQEAMDAGRAHPSVERLAALGRLRRELAAIRGAIEPQLPEQVVAAAPDGGWRLARRPRSEVDTWNAEISLLTGMVAAGMMLDARIGVLRTLPDAEPDAVSWLRRSALALGVEWPERAGVAELLAGLDARLPASLALFAGSTRLLRGARYVAFDGEPPADAGHAGIGAPYAHVTAPIRRLVDRFGAEVCLAVSQDRPVPDWVRAALPELPEIMSRSDGLAARVERACLDQVEAWTLTGRVGETFSAVVLRANESTAEVFIENPPVVAKCTGIRLPEGERITVRLSEVDTERRVVLCEPVS